MNIEKYLKRKIRSLNPDQLSLFNQIVSNILLQLCIPTGTGKGYIMFVDILRRIIKTKESIIAISSHRLMLNEQHLNDLFEMLSPLIGDIGFIFVGSSKYNSSKFQSNTEFNKLLLKKKLSYDEIISSTTSTSEVNDLVKNHLSNGRKVIIMTTYHSLNKLRNLDIDTIYCDEAHTLASDEFSKFQENFESIKSKNKYFTTATPKDCFEDEKDTFLMNNESIFGKRIGLKFKDCVEKGYIPRPLIHIAIPENFGTDSDFKSIPNMTKFIIDTFLYHKNWLLSVSADPTKIAPKILIKCPSVDDMWVLQKTLIGKLPNVTICAGASENKNNSFKHFIDLEGISTRAEYLNRLQSLKEEDMAIVLHYDTMSEGVNVAGFSGVEFLSGKLPTIPKTFQNTGRASRLHPIDRTRLRNGEIKVGDGNMIKPYFAVIIPYWDRESETTSKELAKRIKGLRDEYGFDPAYKVSIGSDIGDGEVKNELDALNQKNKKEKVTELIKNINQEIEQMDKKEEDLSILNDVKNMDIEEWIGYMTNK